MKDNATENISLRSLPEVCSPAQVLACLPVSRDFLYRSLQSGAIPARRLGDRWLIYRDRLIDWLQETDCDQPRQSA